MQKHTTNTHTMIIMRVLSILSKLMTTRIERRVVTLSYYLPKSLIKPLSKLPAASAVLAPLTLPAV